MGLGVLEAIGYTGIRAHEPVAVSSPGSWDDVFFSHAREGHPCNLKSKEKFLVCTECKEFEGWGIYLGFNKSKIMISYGTTKALANW